MSLTIFISYSHEDALLVAPLVRLLRATKGLVFQDVDSIEPGKKWREKIEKALTGANLVVVFWCFHSSQSEEVEKEYRMAILAKKDLLPILLDSMPLPKDLSEFQWIDFRIVVPDNHISKRFSSRFLIAVAICMLTLFGAFMYMGVDDALVNDALYHPALPSLPESAPVPEGPTEEEYPEEQAYKPTPSKQEEEMDGEGSGEEQKLEYPRPSLPRWEQWALDVVPVFVLIMVVIAVAVEFVFWLISRHRSRIARRMEQASEHEYHQKMAEELKAELLRRAEKWNIR